MNKMRERDGSMRFIKVHCQSCTQATCVCEWYRRPREEHNYMEKKMKNQ